MNSSLLDMYKNFKELGSSSDEHGVDYKKFYYATQELIPELVFSDVQSLDVFLRNEINEDIFNLPFWLRALVFKLILLQKPSVDLYERAIADLTLFLPEGDNILVSLGSEMNDLMKKE